LEDEADFPEHWRKGKGRKKRRRGSKARVEQEKRARTESSLLGTNASTSSNTTIHGLFAWASLKTSRSFDSVSPVKKSMD
jgi:hypothetical protein